MKPIKIRLYLTAMMAASVLAMPSYAGEQVIPAGFDIWQTIGAGATGMDFADAPIPAGFFCMESESFTDTIGFDGMPLTTDPPGVLGSTDTIVERLDHAIFKKGMARVRLRIAALNMVSHAVIETQCGAWQVHASLTEDQPITHMDLHLDRHDGGSFNADLVVSVRLTFTSVDYPAEKRVLDRTVHFTEFKEAPFAVSRFEDVPFLLDNLLAKTAIDTNADGEVDRAVSKTGFNTQPLPRAASLLTASAGTVCNPDAMPKAQLRPTSDGCVSVAVVHTSPSHVHTTLPPCGGLTASASWCLQQAPDPEPLVEQNGEQSSFQISNARNVLLQQLQDMHKRGIINDDPQAVLEDLIAKTH